MIKQCECRNTTIDMNWKQIVIKDFWLPSMKKVSFVIYKCEICKGFRGFPMKSFEKAIKQSSDASLEVIENAIENNNKKSFWITLWATIFGRK